MPSEPAGRVGGPDTAGAAAAPGPDPGPDPGSDSGARLASAAVRGQGPRSTVVRWIGRAARVAPDERALLGWSLLFVFSVLSAYYVIRPIRDEMGVHAGVDKLQWLFTGTLLAMLALNPAFSALVRWLPRQRFITVSYLFFIANLAGFAVAFAIAPDAQQVWIGRAFFVWTSVFNLFVVSVFWALMVDIFTPEQGKRLFGLLAAGATIGAIVGASATAILVRWLGTTWLLLVSASLLVLAIGCVRRLSRLSVALHRRAGGAEGAGDRLASGDGQAIGGSAWSGLAHAFGSPYLLGICGYMLLFSITSTLLYFQQANIANDFFPDRAARTRFFASIDVAVNVLTLTVQLFFTGRMLRAFGVAITASVLPALAVIGFGALAAAPTIGVLVAVQVGRRVCNFGLARPTRELLFTVVSREDKYKAKNAIDTVVYRAGDQVGSWSYAGLASLGLGITGIALVAVPLSALWLANSFWLGRRQERLAAARTAPGTVPRTGGPD